MRKRGFTLIELLVVIAIIGLLSAVILASMSGARAKGRDTKRVADIKQLQLALQLYYDQNSSYPPTATDGTVTVALSALTTSNYISVLPVDPGPGSTNVYGYSGLPSGCASGACNDYVLAAQLETAVSGLNGYTATHLRVTVNGLIDYCDTITNLYCVKP